MENINFEIIYEKYFEQVYKYILKISSDVHIAEDITADTFITALVNIDKLKGKSSISTWLISIAKNKYISYLRKNNRISEIHQIPLSYQATDENILENLIDKDNVLHILKILHQIKEPYKEVFMLRILGELSFKDIGEIFRRTDNWACVTFHRAKMMIREKGGIDESKL